MIQQSICIHSQNTKDRFSFNDIIQKKKRKRKKYLVKFSKGHDPILSLIPRPNGK